MVGNGSTYVELKGEFVFAINQSGLDYNDKSERQEAVEDFKRVFQKFNKMCDDYGFIGLDFDYDDIKVREGE